MLPEHLLFQACDIRRINCRSDTLICQDTPNHMRSTNKNVFFFLQKEKVKQGVLRAEANAETLT